jgi:cell wall-associated NlpC family hydrolase
MNHVSKNIIKISTICIAGTILFSINTMTTKAEVVGERAIAGVSVTLNDYSEASEAAAAAEINLADEYDYENIGIAKVDNHLNIRKEPGEDKEIIGKLPKDAGCKILDVDKNGWAKIKSGKVTGYVMNSYLITGDDAVALAKKVGSVVATVNTTTLNVRTEASLLSDVMTSVPVEEELNVVDMSTDWLKVQIDDDKGYISRQYAKLSYQLKKAVLVDELTESDGVSSLRAQLVSYAKQFLGNPYVYGGTSLTNGTDCSGFTMGIYSHFGYSLSRCSRSQAGNGTSISASEIRPGDLIFYGSGSYISHVTMYIGGGLVIHASNHIDGIKISNMYYRDPIKIVRIIND